MKTKLLLLLVLFTSFNSIAQNNIVPNGDIEEWDSFNDNPDDWFRFFNGSWERSDDAQNGTASLELQIDAERSFIFINTPDMQFTAGVTYVCSFYYKVVSGSITTTEFNLSHTPNVFPEDLVSNEFTDLSAFEWKQGAFEYTATTTENVEAFIYARGTANSKILIDNVSIVDQNEVLSLNTVTPSSNALVIYPSPAKDYIQISGLKNGFDTSYTIYDTLGKTVLKHTVSEGQRIDISQLNRGIYFFRTNTGKTHKFLKTE